MAGLMDKLQRMWNPPEDEYEYDDYPEETETEPEESQDYGSSREESRRAAPVSSFSSFSSYTPRENNVREYSTARAYTPREQSPGKVVNINAKTQLQVVVRNPVSFGEEVRSIADELLRRHTVVLNLEKTDKETSRRIVDFLSGVAYANNGKIKRIATSTFIITPYTVDLTGDDVLDELESNGLYF
ncbi:cell division protein SepF [Acutalibacter muris]|jgi:cell division inhibitor SepF|uniref:cell division protein SepF n=1 Tax=Acutalibacter muris TaxID=1796620 RepID=UPI001C3EB682|nr:cell division protein SepF [Acutalibacter muris]MCI9192405.1 cell division protein SepF [Acutalibacter muris]MCI9544380.1 cell division protein SepF [Acutalibacter muris]